MNTLAKTERICSKNLIDRMFTGGEARSFSVFPLRVVYMSADESLEPVSILVSVSKKRFKRAVKRNRVKRQIREAYRLNKGILTEVAIRSGQNIALAFIYLSDELVSSETIQEKMRIALNRIAEKWV